MEYHSPTMEPAKMVFILEKVLQIAPCELTAQEHKVIQNRLGTSSSLCSSRGKVSVSMKLPRKKIIELEKTAINKAVMTPLKNLNREIFSRLARHKRLGPKEGYFDFILALDLFEESYFYHDLIKFLKKSGIKINGKNR